MSFLIGNLAGLYFVNNFNRLKGNYDFFIIIILVLFLLVLKLPVVLYQFNGVYAVFFVPLILLMSFNTGRITKIITNKKFVFLGEISFGIYILQRPVWKWLSDFVMTNYLQIDICQNKNLIFFIRFASLILLSTISYIYFESPMRKKIKNLF